ncbi:dCTP deaminase [Candidatus Poriferisodalis sp.]|uniref:dCTP deaminase n=1 Tax=Candidatus Poriferisodalis sp. TaxID=3101277 RepID=UPI003B01FA2D
MLSDVAIREVLSHEDAAERLVVCPLLDPRQVGTASIDLRLGTEFMEVQRAQQGVLDPYSAHGEHRFNVAFGNELIIHPGQFLLGSTLEYLRVPRRLAGQVLNRSSWARNGLLVATAVTVHPGFTGALTLELVNSGTVPLKLVTGTRICQLVLWELDQETSQPYPEFAKYDTPLGPQPSRLSREGEEQARIIAVGRQLQGQ